MTDTAVILAAGRGSRLGGLTDDRPKCLTELEGRPLLAWQIAALRAAGIERVHVVGGYRRERLAGGDYALLENPRWAETNMVGTLACAADVLRAGPAVVSYSDIVYHPAAVEALRGVDAEIAITYDRRWAALWSARFDDPLADAETFRLEAGRLVEIGRRAATLEEVQGQYMGLLRFTPAGWARVEALLADAGPDACDRMDMTTLLRRLITGGADIRTVPVDGRWCEVDSESDLRLCERELAAAANGPAWSHDWRWEAAW